MTRNYTLTQKAIKQRPPRRIGDWREAKAAIEHRTQS
jgi:hypothetical protein